MLWIVGSPGEILPDRSPAAASHKGCWANIKKKDPQEPQEGQYEEIKNYQEEGSTITQILQSIEKENQARQLWKIEKLVTE